MSDKADSEMDNFTEEAVVTVMTYLRDVRKALKDTDLSEKEIEESISELREHMINHCKIKTPSAGIVTTDLVRSAISKLGEPDVIAKTLSSELSFKFEVEQELIGHSKQKIDTTKGVNITAGHLVQFHTLLSWALTAMIIMFLITQGSLFEVYGWYSLVYLLALLIFYLVKNSKSYQTNLYLQSKYRLNLHILITPIIYIIYGLFIIFGDNSLYTETGDYETFFTLTTVLWLMVATSEGGRREYSIYFNKVQEGIISIIP